MSLLMFSLSPECVFLVTDTLATTTPGDPHLLVTKCGIVPHLDLVVAGTGTAQLPERWRNIVTSQMLCRDVEMLDLHAPATLRRLWADLASEFPEASGATATVYHLGLSESSGEYRGYAYRSTDAFASEPLEPGFRVKPQPEHLPAQAPDEIDEWIDLARRLREEQNARPKGERIHIGGDLNLIVLQNRAITSVKIHRFEDFEEVWQEMNDALGLDSAGPD